MLLAIDEDKVDELLRASGQRYAISIAGLEPMIENSVPYYQNMSASGIVFGERSAMLPKSREHLMEIRSRIVTSGEPLKSADELAREIEEMRGGGR
jgi:hypothetical protein